MARRRPAKAKPSTSPRGRISVDEAFQRLLPVHMPHAAVEQLYFAWCENRARLWCNGNVVPPNFIRTDLVVQAVQEPDGRWRLELIPSRIAWEPGTYVLVTTISAQEQTSRLKAMTVRDFISLVPPACVVRT